MVDQSVTTLASYVESCAREYSSCLFLKELGSGRSITYGDAIRETDRIGEMLHSWDIGRGDRVAILGGNCIHWCLVYLTCVRRGIVIVPILPDFSAMNVRNILSMSEARVIFVSANLRNRVEEVHIHSLEKIVDLDTLSPLDAMTGKPGKKISRIFHRVASYTGKRDDTASKPDDLAAIIYTSGTTGQSKGVMLTQANILSNVRAVLAFCEISDADRFLSLLPPSHTFECTVGFLSPMAGGASIHQLSAKRTPRILLRAMAEVKPTIVLSVPLIMEKIYFKRVKPQIEGSLLLRTLSRIPGLAGIIDRGAVKKLIRLFGGSLRLMALGGAPLHPKVERFMRSGGFPYLVAYGMTERARLISASLPADSTFWSCGHAVEGMSIRIDNPDPRTGIGEIQVRGPNVTQGYFKNPDATRDLFTADGWLRTGDLGSLDENGYLFIKGRSKNMLLGPSGENIYPEEIEQLLNQSPSIIESLVISREKALVDLIVPDTEVLRDVLDLHVLDDRAISGRIQAHFESVVEESSRDLPHFFRIKRFELREREF